MKQRSYRVTYRSDDRLGRVDFVRDTIAKSPIYAIAQVRWQLEAHHPHDHAAYRCVMAVEVERTTAEVEGVPAS